MSLEIGESKGMTRFKGKSKSTQSMKVMENPRLSEVGYRRTLLHWPGGPALAKLGGRKNGSCSIFPEYELILAGDHGLQDLGKIQVT